MLNLAEILKDDHGFTYDPETDTLAKTGYAVSIRKDLEKVYPGFVSNETIEAYIKALPIHGFIGGWYDGTSTYLDVALVVETEREAVSLARSYDQLAYYDFNTETVKYLGAKPHIATLTIQVGVGGGHSPEEIEHMVEHTLLGEGW